MPDVVINYMLSIKFLYPLQLITNQIHLHCQHILFFPERNAANAFLANMGT